MEHDPVIHNFLKALLLGQRGERFFSPLVGILLIPNGEF